MIDGDVIIVDNFYEDAEIIRRMALNAEYNHFDDILNFPGSESKKSFYTADHVKRFEEILGVNIDYNPEKNIFGKFRYSKMLDDAKTSVHLDWDIDWTGIIYLSLDKHSRGGLGLYRHRETGLYRCPKDINEFKKLGYSDVYDFDKQFIIPITKDLDKWELVREIPIKYNRLVLFKGSEYFHGIRDQFGNTIDDSRLTQNFFFNEIKKKGVS